MGAQLQVKGLLGGMVETRQTEAVVHCDPRSLALGTCEGPPPIEETETRQFSTGIGVHTDLSLLQATGSFRFYPQAGFYLLYPLEIAPLLGMGIGHQPSRLDLSAQFLYGVREVAPGGLIGFDWQPTEATPFQIGGHFLYQDGPAFYFSAAWRFDFTSNPNR